MINFEKIIGTKKQIDILYHILSKRKHNISHFKLPNYADHKKFVKNNPYRAWYLIKKNSKYIGSFYLLQNNSISIVVKRSSKGLLSQTFSFIFDNYKPLKEIKSIRPPYFYINVSPSNKGLITYLTKNSNKKIQVTYLLSNVD